MMNLNEVRISARIMCLVFTALFSIKDSRTCHARVICNMILGLDDTTSESDEIVRRIRNEFAYLTNLVGQLMHTMPNLDTKTLCLKVMNNFIITFNECGIFNLSLHHYTYSLTPSMPSIDIDAIDSYDAMYQLAHTIAVRYPHMNEIRFKNLSLMKNDTKEEPMITPYITAYRTLTKGLACAYKYSFTDAQDSVNELHQKALDICNEMDEANEANDEQSYRFVSELTDLLKHCNEEASDYRFFLATALKDTIAVLLDN